MTIAIIVFFALAAVFGLTLLTFVLRDRPTPKVVAMLHGICAATGLVLLIVYGFTEANNVIFGIAGIFLVVALVGFYMITRDLSGHGVPKSIAIIHGSVAIIGFIILIIFLW